MSTTPDRKRGFTMIEAVVALAVVGMIAMTVAEVMLSALRLEEEGERMHRQALAIHQLAARHFVPRPDTPEKPGTSGVAGFHFTRRDAEIWAIYTLTPVGKSASLASDLALSR